LVDDGLLQTADLTDIPSDAIVKYAEAETLKKELLQKAWQKFNESAAPTQQFEDFCEAEKTWLEDYSLYQVLKEKTGGKPWYEWEETWRKRDSVILKELQKENGVLIKKQKWMQFIFFQQWHRFKVTCNKEGIQLIGDIPFYTSYDSADVWAHKSIFKLDEEGQRLGMAGVPPDAFSDDGQLWGMPVYRWDVLKQNDYSWWIERLKKNNELYDLIRLDHFRAFADYWEVKAGAPTAKEGAWKLGPGSHFFETVKKAMGLPFIAEDLGDISKAVTELRDEFALPGMKILQFAFGEGMPGSDFIPHHHQSLDIVYTGTHDNNTTRGWFRKETDKETRENVAAYVGHSVDEMSISDTLSRLGYASVANTVILPMQDILNLDESARMNRPSEPKGNWNWRILPDQITESTGKNLKIWTVMYDRTDRIEKSPDQNKEKNEKKK